jgi:hypothetical protein
MEIINDIGDLNKFLSDNDLKQSIRYAIEGQLDLALESTYPVNKFNWLCCRDIWDDFIADEINYYDVDIKMPYNDIINFLDSEAHNW